MARTRSSKAAPAAVWSASEVRSRPVASLAPYAANARVHAEAQVAQIAASIQEFGFVNPVIIDENGEIIAGHGRVLAAQRLGLIEVPTIERAGLSDAQKRGLRLADNKIALNSGWDEKLLAEELAALSEMDGFDVEITGFDGGELDRLLNTDDEDDERQDAVPDAPAVPVTRLGDVWILGDHRIRCGSSTSAEDVAALLAGAKPHLMVTDPPYGVEYDADWRNKAMRASGRAIGGRATGAVLNDDKADWRQAWALFPGDVAYVWHAGLFAPTVADSLAACGFVLRSQIIWVKSNFAIGRGDYHWRHEPCWYAVRKGATGRWAGDRKQTTTWDIEKPSKSETGHSTQKPVECMQRPIENNSRRGDAVYEPFSGSGTTIIAGQVTGRRVLAMELSGAYCDVAILRWEAFTGMKAALEATGQSFAEVASSRLEPPS